MPVKHTETEDPTITAVKIVKKIETAVTGLATPFPELVRSLHEGAVEVGQLVYIARAQEFHLDVAMQALVKLSKFPDEQWSKLPWMIPGRGKDGRPRWGLQVAELERYKSFADFYDRELRKIFGDWIKLQQAWNEYRAGDSSIEELQQKIRKNAAEAQAINAKAPDLEPHGGDRRSDAFQVDTPKKDVNLKTKGGNDPSYAHSRLRRDRPDIHARVLAGEITAHAGMVEAGFRKKPVRKKLSWVERTIKTMDEKRTKPERRAIYIHLKKEFR